MLGIDELDVLKDNSVMKVLVLGGVVLVVFFLAYLLTEPVMAFHQDLPVDSYQGLEPPHMVPRFDERVKQAWAWMYLPCDGSVMEFGYGNGTVAINLNKRLRDTAVHYIVVGEGVDTGGLMKNREATGCTFEVVKDPEVRLGDLEGGKKKMFLFETIVVHMDGGVQFCEAVARMPYFLECTSTILLETKRVRDFGPILEACGFRKAKNYFYLSIWVREKEGNVAR